MNVLRRCGQLLPFRLEALPLCGYPTASRMHYFGMALLLLKGSEVCGASLRQPEVIAAKLHKRQWETCRISGPLLRLLGPCALICNSDPTTRASKLLLSPRLDFCSAERAGRGGNCTMVTHPEMCCAQLCKSKWKGPTQYLCLDRAGIMDQARLLGSSVG